MYFLFDFEIILIINLKKSIKNTPLNISNRR